MVDMDDLNKKILSELEVDARQSFRDLAGKLKVSVVTVIKRVRALEKQGIIKGYSVVLNPEELGYETAIIELTVSKGKLLEVENQIAKIQGVQQVYDVTGEVDAIIVTKFKERKELSQFVKSLLSMPYVERTNTHVVLTAVKEDRKLFA